MIIMVFFFNFIATPISTPGCEYAFGIYPDSPECSTTYLKCAHGEPSQHHCDDGLAYDERIHGCNWPDQLLHICNPEGEFFFFAWIIWLNLHSLTYFFNEFWFGCSCCWFQMSSKSRFRFAISTFLAISTISNSRR